MVAICCIVHRKRILCQVSFSPVVGTYMRHLARHLILGTDCRRQWTDLAEWVPLWSLLLHLSPHMLCMLFTCFIDHSQSQTLSVGSVCMTLWSPGIVRKGSAWVIQTLHVAVVYIGDLRINCHIIDAYHILSPSINLEVPASFVILHCPLRWPFPWGWQEVSFLSRFLFIWVWVLERVFSRLALGFL